MSQRDHTAATRQARRRVRAALGLRVFRLEMPEDFIAERLISVISEREAADPELIDQALLGLLPKRAGWFFNNHIIETSSHSEAAVHARQLRPRLKHIFRTSATYRASIAK